MQSAASSGVYVFVISSLNNPMYRRIQEKRKVLLRYYNIPYTVLINSEEQDVNNMENGATLTPLLEDEVLYNGANSNPYMSQKFLMAVKMLFRSYPTYNDIPNYIVRINASVYVHFPSLLQTLYQPDMPRERMVAGPNWEDLFVQGMVMVFSKDVLSNILKDPRMYSKSIMKENDDVALSVLADPHSKWMDWNKYLCVPSFYNTCTWSKNICASSSCATDMNGIYLLDKIKPREDHKWIFRIKGRDADGRKTDLENWENLVRYFNEPTCTYSTGWFTYKKVFCLILLIIVMFMIVYYLYKRRAIMIRKNKSKKL